MTLCFLENGVSADIFDLIASILEGTTEKARGVVGLRVKFGARVLTKSDTRGRRSIYGSWEGQLIYNSSLRYIVSCRISVSKIVGS